ncbi:MAG TPA: Wzz/FepE/Etk N-terminal domain-containing protein, partial [Fimbriimonas sp.]|nr:Wzz/FepE/Etk N-terminal domain-containing protein [Fimbriimonas sp.]
MEPKPLNQSTALEIYDRPMYEVDAAPSHLEETPTIFHYLEALWRRKYLFFSILIICLGLGVGYAKTRKKMYSATTSIIVVARGDEGGPNVNDAGVTNLDAQVNLMTQPRNQETQVQL